MCCSLSKGIQIDISKVVIQMNKTFLTILTTTWIFDVFNLPFMNWLDVEIPYNFWAWIITWAVVIVIGSYEAESNA